MQLPAGCRFTSQQRTHSVTATQPCNTGLYSASLTCLNSSLSSRKWRMNSTGSYSENLGEEVEGENSWLCQRAAGAAMRQCEAAGQQLPWASEVLACSASTTEHKLQAPLCTHT